MNCNKEAFKWIITVVRTKHNQVQGESLSPIQIENRLDDLFRELNHTSCLNKLVTSYFLEVTWVYTRIFKDYFMYDFCDVINNCKISLSNLNDTILYHISCLMTD